MDFAMTLIFFDQFYWFSSFLRLKKIFYTNQLVINKGINDFTKMYANTFFCLMVTINIDSHCVSMWWWHLTCIVWRWRVLNTIWVNRSTEISSAFIDILWFKLLSTRIIFILRCCQVSPAQSKIKIKIFKLNFEMPNALVFYLFAAYPFLHLAKYCSMIFFLLLLFCDANLSPQNL